MPIIKVNDIDLYYDVVGEGEPVLFLHGLGSSTRDWEMQVPAFTSQFRVITVDVRGHGQSGKPSGPYSVKLFADDLISFMDKIGLGSVHVIGVSMGGMIAFQMAVSYANRVKSMVIVNSAPELKLRGIRPRLQGLMRIFIVRFMGMRKMGEVLAKRLFPKQDQEAIRQTFIERWAENDPKAYLAALRALVGWSVMPQISDISIPILVIASDNDYTPVALKEEYVAKIQQAELTVVEDARHAVPIEHPDRFNSIIHEFLEKHKTPKA